ncbi:MAG: AAA family ATPase [Nannocystaceae bacterium]
MYLKKVILQNIRAHSGLTLDFNNFPGWHVLIGDNGAGKSTLVRAIALALAGPTEIAALRQDWREWLRTGCPKGSVTLHLNPTPTWDKRTGKGRYLQNYYLALALDFDRHTTGGRQTVTVTAQKRRTNPRSYVWGTGSGWFSASYGPFRRFSGGDKDYEKLFYSNPRLAPHLTVFGEDIALTEALSWLQQLRVRQLEGEISSEPLELLTAFVNESGLLPHDTRLKKVTGTQVLFLDGNGCELRVEHLSDGYRSVLSLTFELLRQLAAAYGDDVLWQQLRDHKDAIKLPGVVLIDEVDAHLHPTWQRTIGLWFRQRFPLIQFIVTTHSPLVCQAADAGSVWQLSKPGEGGGIRKVTGVEYARLVYGNVLDALGTDLFGKDVARSDAAFKKLQRLAQLNLKSVKGSITDEEHRELEDLRKIFPSDAGSM